MLCAKIGWNWVSGSIEENYKFSHFRYYIPLERAKPPHLNKLESTLSKDALCQFGWNWPNGSREDENVKSLWTDGQTYRESIRKDHLSFQHKWVKNNYIHVFFLFLVEIGQVVLKINQKYEKLQKQRQNSHGIWYTNNDNTCWMSQEETSSLQTS